MRPPWWGRHTVQCKASRESLWLPWGESGSGSSLQALSFCRVLLFPVLLNSPVHKVTPSLIHAKGKMESAFVGWKLDCGGGGGGGEVTEKPRHPGLADSGDFAPSPSLWPWVLCWCSRSKLPVCQMPLFPLSLPLWVGMNIQRDHVSELALHVWDGSS